MYLKIRVEKLISLVILKAIWFMPEAEEVLLGDIFGIAIRHRKIDIDCDFEEYLYLFSK